jgi:predicted dehydrogenase
MTTATAPLATAIVGCGVIGRTHVESVLAFDELELVALIDPVRERADALADEVEARTGARPRVFASIEDLVRAGVQVGLVVIGTPSGLHVEQGIAALEAGAHVIIETPLDVDLVRARRLADAARAHAGQVCTIISQHRFDPASQVVHAAIEAGRFGRLTSAVATVPWWRSQGYYDSGDWRGTWALDGGGALMNQGVHTLDLLLWVLGRPVSVSAEFALLAHDGVEVEDTVVATITFASGALAVLHATTAGYPGLAVRLQVQGSAGSAVIDSDELEYIHVADATGGNDMGLQGGGNQRDRYGLDAANGDAPVDATQSATGHERQYRDLLDAVADGRDPIVTVDEALFTLATVRAVYASAATGSKVRIDDVLAGAYDDVELVVPAPQFA